MIAEPAVKPAPKTGATRGAWAAVLFRLRALVALGALVLVFSILSPAFLTAGNLTILLRHVAINAIMAVGMTFVILSGGIDLSVGSIAGLAGMIAGLLIDQGLRLPMFGIVVYFQVWLVIVVALLAGAAVGVINGVLIARLGVAPFIATLGTMYAARGAALLVSNGATFPNLAGKPELRNTGFPLLGSGANPIWLMIGVAVAGAVLAARTPFGRHVYAVGGNVRAALLSGVRVKRVEVLVYVISGVCSAVVGLVIASQLVAAHPATGEAFELNAIAAVVLGGTSLMGGRGGIGGTIAGALVIGALADGLVLLGVSEFWQIVIKGIVIIVAVVMDQVQRRRFAWR